MGESDLTVYEKIIAGVNTYLSCHELNIITEKDYDNPRLYEALGGCKNGNDYETAMLALSALSRDKDAEKLCSKTVARKLLKSKDKMR